MLCDCPMESSLSITDEAGKMTPHHVPADAVEENYGDALWVVHWAARGRTSDWGATWHGH